MPIEVDPSILTTFLDTYMKLLCNNKAMKGLQELMNKCASKENALDGHRVVLKIGKHKVINLKKRMMLFERKSLRVVVPLDPTEGAQYTEPVCDYEESDDELEKIYKITARDKDNINSITDG